MELESFSSQVQEIKKIFDERGLTLALAESCTGGLISATIAEQPGVSSFFLGSVVSYHSTVKHKILKVPMSLIQVMGEVSYPVALEMARGVKFALKSDWALSVTGVAGPTGGTVEKPVGYVCFGLVGPGVEHSESQSFGSLPRGEIQRRSAGWALDLLLRHLRA